MVALLAGSLCLQVQRMGLRSFLQRDWEGVTMVVEERSQADHTSQEQPSAPPTAPSARMPGTSGSQAARSAAQGGARPVSRVPLEFITQTLLPSLLSDVHSRQLGGSGAAASTQLLVTTGPQLDVQVRVHTDYNNGLPPFPRC
jgi:hypothetical protein